MNHIPSTSISKSILLATPLFMIVLAILHASSEISYMFVLDFVNKVGGSADIVFIPTLQTLVPQGTLQQAMHMAAHNLQPLPYEDKNSEKNRIPLVNIQSIQKWAKNHDIINGVSPRWVLPSKSKGIDTYLFGLNISRQIQIQTADLSMIQPLERKTVAVESSLLDLLGLDIGDKISVDIQPKNLLAGIKMFEKYQQSNSRVQDSMEYEDTDPTKIAAQLYGSLEIEQLGISEVEFIELIDVLFNEKTTTQLMIAERLYPNGLYPSKFNNVLIVELDDLYEMFSVWMLKALVKVGKFNPKIKELLPPQLQDFWPTNQFEVNFQKGKATERLSQALEDYSLMVVTRLKDREQIYNPNKGQKYNQFLEALQQMPGKAQEIVVYPLYKQSLAIKFFFDSVVQIFQFVTCILYFYTMTLIMKQIYEQKQIEVGIWRTLGAGAVSHSTTQKMIEERSTKKNSSKFKNDLTLKQKLRFFSKIAVKVGYIYYWLFIVAVSLVLYVITKLIVYKICADQLKFSILTQPILLPTIVTLTVLSFIFVLCLTHIMKIFNNPLSQTIKPVKRTFDVVKVRIIYLATFGVSFEILMIAVMLIYYGVVSYYWIPFAILDGDSNLQILLLNTIFIFMIFGAIILLSIFQSRLQILLFELIFLVSKPFRSVKSIIRKNIKAKQYKNIKVAIIVSVIFAFVLFFTTGINVQIQIIQSFIERALGAELVFENYGRKVFDQEKVEKYLDEKGLQYSWLSVRLDRDNVSIHLIDHVSGSYIGSQFQVLTATYLNSTFYQYYFPEEYLSDSKNYWQLPNSIRNGFNSIYTGDNGCESVGKYNQSDTITDLDPNKINNYIYHKEQMNVPFLKDEQSDMIPPEQQVINLVISSSLRKQLGVKIGSLYKMIVQNKDNKKSYYMRARFTHSFKQGPGFDVLHSEAFMSEQQAEYIYRILDVQINKTHENQKLFVKGSKQELAGVGNAIISMSPQETQAFDIQFVSISFELFERYLNAYVVFITAIMSGLAILFLFLYTVGKCQQESEMYKMLRAIGLSIFRIRMMVFSEIMIRLFVAIFDGIVLGIILSVGFSLQVEQFLMLKTPKLNITIVVIIAAILFVIFSITVIQATKYLSKRTVATTNKSL